MVSMVQLQRLQSELRFQQRFLPHKTLDGAQRLLGLPAIHEDEVFTSWLARMMLCRRINKRKLLEEVNLKDLFYISDLNPTAFNLPQLVMRFNLVRIGLLEQSFIQFQPGMAMNDSLCLTTEIFNRKPICRFCPHCIIELPYIRKSWRYAFSYACPKHGCLLLERCSKCDGSINFEKLNLSKMDDLDVHDLSSCLSCGASLATQRSSYVTEKVMHKIISRQEAVYEDFTSGKSLNKYIAQIRYSENGIPSYLNVGVSGADLFKDDADEIRTSFRKAGIFMTTYWQPSGCIFLRTDLGKVKSSKRWVKKQLDTI